MLTRILPSFIKSKFNIKYSYRQNRYKKLHTKIAYDTDVMVIGGGIVGASIALAISKYSNMSVMLVDKGEFGKGGTSNASGVSEKLNKFRFYTQMREKSDEFYSQVKGIKKRDIGSLSLATTESIDKFFNNLKINDFYGLTEAQLIEPEEIKYVMAGINTDGLYSALYMPTDVYIDPYSLTIQLIEEAKKYSLKVKENVMVDDIFVKKDKVVGVSTSDGIIVPNYVVNATGAWAQFLNCKLKYYPPALYFLEQTLLCDISCGLFPSVRDINEKIFFSPTTNGIIVKCYQEYQESNIYDNQIHNNTDDLSDEVIQQRFNDIFLKVFNRAPFLQALDFTKLVNNPILVTLDGNPIVGKIPHIENAYVAMGILDGICCAGDLAMYLNKLIRNPNTQVIPSISTDRFQGYVLADWEKECNTTYGNLFFPIA